MEYLFSNKEILVNDVGLVIITLEQAHQLKLPKYFPTVKFTNTNRLGLKIQSVSKHHISGYMVQQLFIDGKEKLVPRYFNNKKIVLTISSGQCIGVIKY